MQTSAPLSLLALVERCASVGVWTLDLQRNSLHWSAELARIHETDAGYVPAWPQALDHYAPPWRDEMRARIEACVQHGQAFDVEAQIVTMQGRRLWVRSVGEAVLDASGAVTGVHGVLQEVASQGYAPGTLLRHMVDMAGAPDSPQAFVTLDTDGAVNYANHAAARLLAPGAETLQGRPIWDFFQKSARLQLEDQFRRACAGGIPLELEALDAAGGCWLELRAYPFGAGLALHLRDVTARHRAQEQLRLLEGSIARLNDLVIITEAGPFGEPGPRIVFVNEAFERRTGYAGGEVLGRTPRLLQGPATQREALDRIRTAMERWAPARVELINYTRSGEPFWLDLSVSPVWDKARRLTHWVAVGRDITERKIAEEKIQNLAFYDPLTQLPNRQMLMERLQEALGGQGPHEGALMFIDLDNFKALNDTLGHQKGDLLLQQAARRLRASVAKGDLVARLGGDEFVILLQSRPEKPIEPERAARAVSQRVLASLGEPYVLPDLLHHATCSIGVTLFRSGDATSLGDLLKQADLAMYDAKAAGRNTVRFFDPGMQALATANAALAADLRQAWHERALHIEYQPQVGEGGRMTGVEALLRWHHPRRGVVPPARFIPIAEDSGLIMAIGRWVLESACAQLASWADKPGREHLEIAVNVSVRQFRHPDFVDEVTAAIVKHGIAPRKLKLELTESLLAEGMEVTVAKMGTLKQMGVTLSLDDFGIGYSALAYLKRLPLDQLKIDREFVRDILTDANDAAIARAIIHLAHSLGLDVIAEGVETAAQRDFLAREGCVRYQGYLFSPPLPLARLEAFIDRLATPAPSAAGT